MYRPNDRWKMARQGAEALDYVHFASKQSIIDRIISNLFRIEKFKKFVSSSTMYGGPKAVLY